MPETLTSEEIEKAWGYLAKYMPEELANLLYEGLIRFTVAWAENAGKVGDPDRIPIGMFPYMLGSLTVNYMANYAAEVLHQSPTAFARAFLDGAMNYMGADPDIDFESIMREKSMAALKDLMEVVDAMQVKKEDRH